MGTAMYIFARAFVGIIALAVTIGCGLSSDEETDLIEKSQKSELSRTVSFDESKFRLVRDISNHFLIAKDYVLISETKQNWTTKLSVSLIPGVADFTKSVDGAEKTLRSGPWKAQIRRTGKGDRIVLDFAKQLKGDLTELGFTVYQPGDGTKGVLRESYRERIRLKEGESLDEVCKAFVKRASRLQFPVLTPYREKPLTGPVPIYVEPFYNSKGTVVKCGAHDDALAGMSKETVDDVLKTLEANRDQLTIETMFVASIRLYDLGRKKEAVHWFYSARFRSRLLAAVLVKRKPAIGSPDFERTAAQAAFQRLVGKYINGYAFGNLEQLRKTLRDVLTKSKKLPDFQQIYPDAAVSDSETWQAHSEDVKEEFLKLVLNPA